MHRGVRILAVSLGVCSVVACSRPTVPDPRQAALAWADATERGDANALHAMLTERSRATITPREVAAIVKRDRAELADQGKDVRTASSGVVAVARLRYADGAEASLSLEKDEFRVLSAGILPGGGSTPQEALAAFRQALERRSFSAVLRLLSPGLRAQVEAQIRSIIDVLVTSGRVEVTGDTATFSRDGHVVTLRREQGIWYVDNFE